MLSGLPASGKSTFAERWVNEDPERRIRVNRDSLRYMAQFNRWSRDVEEQIIKPARDTMIKQLLQNNFNVINDDTNLSTGALEYYEKLLEDIDVDIEHKFIDAPTHVCIVRDEKREQSVGKKVILSMANRYLNPIHKFNGGRGATLCHGCTRIITEGLTDDKLCEKCKEIIN